MDIYILDIKRKDTSKPKDYSEYNSETLDVTF
jgi:hypothetical protein